MEISALGSPEKSLENAGRKELHVDVARFLNHLETLDTRVLRELALICPDHIHSPADQVLGIGMPTHISVLLGTPPVRGAFELVQMFRGSREAF
jgi:hypothetical protein